MFVVSLHYTAPLSTVDAHLSDHLAWLRAGYERGVFLASGRKVPRTGGVILATGTRAELEALLARDPFATLGIATYDVTEFEPTLTSPTLTQLRGA